MGICSERGVKGAARQPNFAFGLGEGQTQTWLMGPDNTFTFFLPLGQSAARRRREEIGTFVYRSFAGFGRFLKAPLTAVMSRNKLKDRTPLTPKTPKHQRHLEPEMDPTSRSMLLGTTDMDGWIARIRMTASTFFVGRFGDELT